jgi:hypothetical protein
MSDKPSKGDRPEMEDYGEQDADTQPSAFGDRTDDDITPASNTQGRSAHAAADKAGMGTDESPYSGGTGGGQLGEVSGSKTGMTTESPNIDPRTGQVKGGQSGASDSAGTGQYGGDAGSVTED